jgi:hypothetical protein
VLYDQVPGGTGYLGPLADADEVKTILTAAREHIARCVCRTEGRQACHRCLLGVVDRWEYDLVRRDLAKELLDALLDEYWDPTGVPTVADVSIAQVEESELERRFKVALREWVEHDTGGELAYTRVPGKGRYEAFELTITRGAEVMRYRIEEQAGLLTSPNTQPDFLIRRMDTSAPDVAVYLDGYQFHASPDHNRIADDAVKRAGVRASGRYVWSLSWVDVDRFHKAVTADPPQTPPTRSMLDPGAKVVAQQVQHARDGALPVKLVEANPVQLLLDYLTAPDGDDWRRVARSVVGGLAASSGTLTPMSAGALGDVLDAALAGEPIDPGGLGRPGGDAVAQVAVATTANGHRLVLALDTADPNAERWTAISVLPDGQGDVEAQAHLERWTDWLAWANVLQFLGKLEDSTGAVIAGASRAFSGDHDDIWLRHVAKAPAEATGPAGAGEAAEEAEGAGPPAALTVEQVEELELVDDDVRRLVESVLRPDGPRFVAGVETSDGHIVEAAFPDHNVGVLRAGDEVPPGWDARTVDEWTTETLREALRDVS